MTKPGSTLIVFLLLGVSFTIQGLLRASKSELSCSTNEALYVRAGIRSETLRWENQTVVYKISEKFSESETATIMEGFQAIADQTCIKFVKRTTEKDWVLITRKPRGCWSDLGRLGGQQRINLEKGCLNTFYVAHEAMHTLGCAHEHSRHDRDDYVWVNYTNIPTDRWGDFRKLSESEFSTYGLKYNYSSIMHYGAYALAIDPAYPTIIPLKPNVTLGDLGGEVLTTEDAELLNRMYGCG